MEKNSVYQFSSQTVFGSTQKGQISKLPRINVSLLLNPGTVLICQCEHFPPEPCVAPAGSALEREEAVLCTRSRDTPPMVRFNF